MNKKYTTTHANFSTKMKNKIKKARNMLYKMSKQDLQNNQSDTILKLKEITDKAELTYNDLKIKRFRSQTALQSMRDLESKLDEILLGVINETEKKTE